MLRVENNVSVWPCYLLAKHLVRVSNSAARALRADGRQTPANLADGRIDVVLQIHHAAHQTKRHARAILTVPNERSVRKVLVWVRCWAIMQLVRPHPVCPAHLGNDGALWLRCACGQRLVVHLVGLVVLLDSAILRAQHNHLYPTAIPDLEQTHPAILGVHPLLFLDARSTLLVPCAAHVSRCTTICRQLVPIRPSPCCAINQLCVRFEHQLGLVNISPAAAHQIPGIAQVRLFAQEVPEYLVTMHGLAAVRKRLKRVSLAHDLDPTDTDTALCLERIGTCLVCTRLALCMVELLVQSISHIVTIQAISRQTPVSARLGLQTQHCFNSWANQRLNCRGHTDSGLPAQHLTIKLVSINVLHLIVSTRAPCRLIAHLGKHALELDKRKPTIIFWLVKRGDCFCGKGVDHYILQSGGGGGSTYAANWLAMRSTD